MHSTGTYVRNKGPYQDIINKLQVSCRAVHRGIFAENVKDKVNI